VNAQANGADVVVLETALGRLDALLRRAVSVAQRIHADAAAHPYRGLCVTDEEAEALCRREPFRSSLWGGAPADGLQSDPTHAPRIALQHLLGLSDFELDVVLIALAPELDAKYERLFAYLNDDLTKKWPTTELALSILCPSSAERLTRYRELAGNRLLSLGLLQAGGTDEDDTPLLSRRLRLDPIAIRYLCNVRGLDDRLRRFCTLCEPAWALTDVPVGRKAADLLHLAATRARAGERVRVHLLGPEGSGQAECAQALAATVGAQVLMADLSQAPEPEHRKAIRLVLLQARLCSQLPVLKGAACAADGRIRDLLACHPGPIVFDGHESAAEDAALAVTIELAPPEYEQRRGYWDRFLGAEMLPDREALRDELTERFELSFPQIRAVVSGARCAAEATGQRLTREVLMASARQHSHRELAAKAELIEPRRSWADLVLHEDAAAQLHELCNRVRRRHRVLDKWGFGRMQRGLGVTALFVGASGTGKTLAAEVVAGELGLNLYRIELSAVVSKYVGETEKNLESIFRDAEQSNAVLLFDEAEALFGKRSPVRDAHDRYANVEIAYLLQRLESYPGVAVLTTNLSDNLDPSFARRLAYTVHFPFPTPTERQRIWETVWPSDAPLGADVQPGWLAERFKLTGGNIRNVALAAASLVDDDGSAIGMAHIVHALRREYQKMGKALAEREIGRLEASVPVAAR
jgi:hypothetical protein